MYKLYKYILQTVQSCFFSNVSEPAAEYMRISLISPLPHVGPVPMSGGSGWSRCWRRTLPGRWWHAACWRPPAQPLAQPPPQPSAQPQPPQQQPAQPPSPRPRCGSSTRRLTTPSRRYSPRCRPPSLCRRRPPRRRRRLGGRPWRCGRRRRAWSCPRGPLPIGRSSVSSGGRGATAPTGTDIWTSRVQNCTNEHHLEKFALNLRSLCSYCVHLQLAVVSLIPISQGIRNIIRAW